MRDGREWLRVAGVLAVAVCAGLGLAGCGEPAPRNLLLVTFDTTRADHLGCYGKPGASPTPHVDALAAEGVRFERAFTAAPITAPAHATILTGRYPLSHGVRDNGLFVLAPEEVTLAETLRAHGWATAAAVGAFPLVARFGLDQGFDLFDDRVARPPGGSDRPVPPASLFFDQRPAGWVNTAVLPWLEEHAQRPFFLWLHYYDPHQPLAPPAPYDQLYAADPYTGEIAYADESLGTVLTRLRELGVWDRTVVVLTSDHGEGLGEHGEATHSLLLYNGTLRVPLVIRAPGGARGRVVEQTVGTVDIVPTVLELLEIEPQDGKEARRAEAPPLDGRSLAPWITGSSGEPPPRPLYAETLSPRLGYRWGELRAWLDGDLKYVHGPRPELFDLAADFAELHDLAGDPARARQAHDQLARFLRERASKAPARALEIDPETRARLQALGYVQRDDAHREAIEERLREDGAAPQDRVGDVSDLSAAKALLHRGQFLQAREVIDGLLARSTESLQLREMRARAELALGRHDAALADLERASALAGAEAAPRLSLQMASVALDRGDAEAARDHVRKSAALRPSAPAELLLAALEARLGSPARERAALDRALALEPGYAPARVQLAVRLAEGGDGAGAEREFRRALADQPYDARAHHNYATYLAQAGRLDEALASFERSLALEPRRWEAHYGRIVVERELGRAEDARRHGAELQQLAPGSEAARRAAALLGKS